MLRYLRNCSEVDFGVKKGGLDRVTLKTLGQCFGSRFVSGDAEMSTAHQVRAITRVSNET